MAKTQNKFTEDWLPVKKIENGMIILENNWMVTGIKVEPKNIFILDYQTQNNIIFNFRNFYNTIDYEFWLIVADRPVDIKMYLSQLQLDFDNAQTQAIRKLIAEDIQKAELFSGNDYNVVDTEYYFIFQEKKLEVLQKKLHNMISGLATCGLQSMQTSNDDLRMILDNFLNGGEQINFGTVMS